MSNTLHMYMPRKFINYIKFDYPLSNFEKRDVLRHSACGNSNCYHITGLHLDISDVMHCKKWRKLLRGRKVSGDESGRCIF